MSSPISAPKHQASESISTAYDAIAPLYDSQLTPAQWIRDRLWERMDALFPSGSRVLDVTAGTGLDALHLSERGVAVVACDISSKMLAQLHAKSPNIETRLVDFNELDLNEEFDGIISTFAGLNTSPDLRLFAKSAARLLRPGGVLFIHLLNRWCLLEIARHFVRLNWRQGWRAVTSNLMDVNIGGALISHYLYSPFTLYSQIFASDFHLSQVSGHGIIRPVGSRWGTPLKNLDKGLGGMFPFSSLGSFFSLELIRK